MRCGSCICNLLLVVGIASVIRPIKVDKRITKIHIPLGIVAMIVLLLLGNISITGTELEISKTEGILLIVITGLYLIYTIYEEKAIEKEENKEEEKIKTISIAKTITYILLGITGLKIRSRSSGGQ